MKEIEDRPEPARMRGGRAATSGSERSAAEHRVYSARLALQDHQQQLDADGVMVGVSREALDVLLKHFSDTWNELHCCDDVNLSEGLSGGIADLCRQRDYWRLLALPDAQVIASSLDPAGEASEAQAVIAAALRADAAAKERG